jgi:hypothetical protein
MMQIRFVQLIMLVYPSIVMEVWIQCLDLLVLMGWISYSCTWIANLDEKNSLV